MFLCSTLYFYNTDLVFNVSAKIHKTFAVNYFYEHEVSVLFIKIQQY